MQSAPSLYQETADQNHSLPGESGNYGEAVIGKQNKTGQMACWFWSHDAFMRTE